MKTVKDYLANCDRDALIQTLCNNRLSDIVFLLEQREMTVDGIIDRYSRRMDQFIDTVLELKPLQSDGILFLFDVIDDPGYEMRLVKAADLLKSIDCETYGFMSVEWEEALGYRVAETKLTQDNITELLAQFVDEITFFGTNRKKRDERIEALHQSLEESAKEAREGMGVEADEFFDQLYRKKAWPIPEKDEKQNMLRDDVNHAKSEYAKYSMTRELQRIRNSITEEEVKCPT